MSKIEIFSKKLGKTMTVETASMVKKANMPKSSSQVMGWTNSGWTNSGGW